VARSTVGTPRRVDRAGSEAASPARGGESQPITAGPRTAAARPTYRRPHGRAGPEPLSETTFTTNKPLGRQFRRFGCRPPGYRRVLTGRHHGGDGDGDLRGLQQRLLAGIRGP